MRIPKFSPHLRNVNYDFLLSPRLGGSKLRKQPHAPPLHSIHPMLIVDCPSLLVPTIPRPSTNRPFVDLLVHFNESGFADGACHGIDDVAFSACGFAAHQHFCAPGSEDAVCGDTVVVALDGGESLELFYPASGT